ncbi:MAG: AzlC family ABC transporter permease [Ruminococcaceae bacterium]|nr:AzlC family ABC transporter permease [Oscillospiraceae bacterium]
MQKSNSRRARFTAGFRCGAPIMLGYAPVAFAFAVGAVGSGLPWWIVVLISLTNFTSAGQKAGADLMISCAPLSEIGAAVFVINIRYILMSLSLTQRMLKMPLVKKLTLANGVTDEIYFLSMKQDRLSGWFFAGLSVGPYVGWVGGTLCGALAGAVLPASLSSALGIALFAMFIAIIIPEIKKSRAVAVVCVLAAGLSALLYYVPVLNAIPSGWALIIAAVIAAAVGAWLFPMPDEEVAA